MQAAIDTLVNVAVTGVTFLLMITVLVAVHELGHFWFARMFGIKVEAFSVMMGGVRKSPLEKMLPKPLVSSLWVWAVALVGAGAALIGANIGVPLVLDAGLVVAGVLVPVWVASRLQALYHYRDGTGYRILGLSWLAVLALIGITFVMGGGIQNLGLIQILALISCGSAVGLLIVYYQPVLKKADNAPMGHGRIWVPQDQEVPQKVYDLEVEAPRIAATASGMSESSPPEDKPMGSKSVPVMFRPLWSATDKKGTEFSLLTLPLGGFAAMKGMHPREDGSEVEIPEGFYSKAPWKRLLVLFAGPLFSILLGIGLFYSMLVAVGELQPVNRPEVGAVVKDGPAYEAGLRQGDVIMEIEDEPVDTFYDVVVAVRDRGGEPIDILYRSEGEVIPATLTPELDEEPTPVLGPDLEPTEEEAIQAKMGLIYEFEYVPVDPVAAIGKSFILPVRFVEGLGATFSSPENFAEGVGGPGSIVKMTSQAAEEGVAQVLILAGLLSITLGIMNLLPVPPLDGGQMVIAFAEMIRGGKRLSIRVQHAMSTIGFLLVLLLMLSTFALDIGRFTGSLEDPFEVNEDIVTD